MGQLLYFYYIEAHTDRVVARAFCTELYACWVEKKRQSASVSHMISPTSTVIVPTNPSDVSDAAK